ncbi:hypothetical protein QAD02_004456 [Eretmocerus hayati]|uniref:Uncharacterized protein n=1 Tax=Eretmocerus hayati TaxID=131215 RepID=A0ACC2NPK6_9HYME|nr:hypothetical protein QAD02_004456 [Eretmocerus hayati]
MTKKYELNETDREMVNNRRITRSISRAAITSKKLRLSYHRDRPITIQGCSKNCSRESPQSKPTKLDLLSLPLEIHLEILRHLSCRDLQALRRVCRHFDEIAMHPSFWTELEISKNEKATKDLIEDLKKMTMLKNIQINDRDDVNDLLKQISRSSTHLEQLVVSYPETPTGTTCRYLDSTAAKRIVERCPRLHTFDFSDNRFQGLRLFRSLGRAGARIRFFRAKLRTGQIETFIRHIEHVTPKSRDLVADLCASRPARLWSTVIYRVNEGASVIRLRQNVLTFKQSG